MHPHPFILRSESLFTSPLAPSPCATLPSSPAPLTPLTAGPSSRSRRSDQRTCHIQSPTVLCFPVGDAPRPARGPPGEKAGGLCTADEVQSGFARTGSHFWGFETQGVVPDIVTVAKEFYPGRTPEIAQVLTRRSYFNTFGGNPVCTAGGLAVLGAIEREKLQENAFLVGFHLIDRLKALKKKHEIIGDVRGRGLMIGVELVTDRHQKTPASSEILHVMDQMKDMGVLVGKGGFYCNVFRITPPLCFTKEEDADFFFQVMDVALSKL